MFVFLFVFSRPGSKQYKLHIHGVYSENLFLLCLLLELIELSLQNIKSHFLSLSHSKHEEVQLYTLIFFLFQLKKNEKKKNRQFCGGL